MSKLAHNFGNGLIALAVTVLGFWFNSEKQNDVAVRQVITKQALEIAEQAERDRMQAEKDRAELALLKQRLGDFVPKSEFGVEFASFMLSRTIGITADGKIQNAFPIAAKMFGYRPDELKGKPITDLVPDYWNAKSQDGKSTLKQAMDSPQPADIRPVFFGESDGIKKDGSHIHVEIRTRLMDMADGRAGMSLFTDKLP